MGSSCLLVQGPVQIRGTCITQHRCRLLRPATAVLQTCLIRHQSKLKRRAQSSSFTNNAAFVHRRDAPREGPQIASIRSVLLDPATGPRKYSTLHSTDGVDFGSGHKVLYDTPRRGAANPLGASMNEGKTGVNFAVTTDGAETVSLCLFTEEDLQKVGWELHLPGECNASRSSSRDLFSNLSCDGVEHNVGYQRDNLR